MKRFSLVFVFLISSICLGCNNEQDGISSKVYKTFFQNLVGISIMTTESKIDLINTKDVNKINTIKDEMRDISILKEYSSAPNYGGVFKDEKYRLIFLLTKIGDKKYKVLELLYSTKDAVMIAREGDMFPEKKPKTFEEKISVCEFEIPQKVNTLLKQCENRLQKEGFFFNTWGENFN
jgi:hypothetical protein